MRAVNIPQLLTEIISLLERRDLVRLIALSSLWSEIALDILWQDLPSLVPLLKTLHPLKLLPPGLPLATTEEDDDYYRTPCWV